MQSQNGKQSILFNIEFDERNLNTEIQNLEFSREQHTENHGTLKQEREATENHIRVLENQRNQLREELDSFISADISVKENLNRHTVVHDHIVKNEMNRALSRSPPRYSGHQSGSFVVPGFDPDKIISLKTSTRHPLRSLSPTNRN